MKKLFIGLLIIAAGTGVFFFLRKKNKDSINTIHKDWIIGKWQIQEPNPVNDSAFTQYRYDFQKGGLLLQSVNDSIAADTMHYEWNKLSNLLWKKTKSDSIAREFSIEQLTKDSLQIRGADSIKLILTRLPTPSGQL